MGLKEAMSLPPFADLRFADFKKKVCSRTFCKISEKVAYNLSTAVLTLWAGGGGRGEGGGGGE